MASYDPSPKDENAERIDAGPQDDVAILVAHNGHDAGRRSMRGCGISALVWFACVGFFYLYARASSGKGSDDGMAWGVIAWPAMIFAVLIGPALGVLYGLEVVSYLNWRKKKGMANIFWRLFIGFWLLVFAALFLGFGVAGMYFVGRGMIANPDFKDLVPNLGALLLSLGLAVVGAFLAWQALRRTGASTETEDIAAAQAAAEEERREWEAVDFASLEQQLGCTLPAAFKAMMQPGSEWRKDSWTLHPKGLENEDEIYSILALHPPNEKALRTHPATGETMLCFGSADSFEYWLRPGHEDPPVYECFMESPPFDVTEIAPRLSVFLAWPKEQTW
ncbi:hypothetical protein DES53_104191 [Roseimicrobium gellanilyticum]|uniref:Knr4/Smi1-like domain-containing protein n=1 Tax=Roseimicrobium gellanilyticum TaxID=748857 RepID=A0A366HPC6_9BACT|nr:SMI1/KNR4 family protein [Roseimicrobium gellanilyticum]RBP44371.1 hypothetical protein DES53_104191 [Roseimicrobium gellanilyticum]